MRTGSSDPPVWDSTAQPSMTAEHRAGEDPDLGLARRAPGRRTRGSAMNSETVKPMPAERGDARTAARGGMPSGSVPTPRRSAERASRRSTPEQLADDQPDDDRPRRRGSTSASPSTPPPRSTPALASANSGTTTNALTRVQAVLERAQDAASADQAGRRQQPERDAGDRRVHAGLVDARPRARRPSGDVDGDRARRRAAAARRSRASRGERHGQPAERRCRRRRRPR